MVKASRKSPIIAALFCLLIALIHSQDPASPLDNSGRTTIDGRSAPYLIRHLPVNAFPQLPPAIQAQLSQRGCLIPQTYEAHRPENVVNASLEHRGSSDWAILCSVKGTVSLLIFFSSSVSEPTVLASAPETSRLQAHGAGGVLGFNWGIDPATPEEIHDAQLNMHRPPPRPEHDGLADSVVEGRTIYRFCSHGTWTILDTED